MGCRRRAPKPELVRIVGTSGGAVRIDPEGNAPGRGAYVCSNVDCLVQAIRRDRVGRALRCVVDKRSLEGLKEEVRRAAHDRATPSEGGTSGWRR
ncbi:MAG: YlxR family protein [Actinomycetota bacterium]